MKTAILVLAALLSLQTFAEDRSAADNSAGKVSLATSVLKRHQMAIDSEDCQADEMLGMQTSVSDLGQGRKLYIVGCMMGAYQGSSRAYVTSGEQESNVLDVNVLSATVDKEIVATNELGDASYDSKTGLLYTNAKGRGMADCGDSSISKISIVFSSLSEILANNFES